MRWNERSEHMSVDRLLQRYEQLGDDLLRALGDCQSPPSTTWTRRCMELAWERLAVRNMIVEAVWG